MSDGRRVGWASRPPCGASCATPGGVSGRSARDGRAAILHRALRRMRSAAGETPTLPAAHRSVLERLFISGRWYQGSPTARSTEKNATQTSARTNPDLDAHQPRGRLTLTQRRTDITHAAAHTAQTPTHINPEVGCTDPGMGCHDPEWCSHRPRARLPSPRAGLYGPRGWLLQLRPVFSARRELKLLPRQGHTPACP